MKKKWFLIIGGIVVVAIFVVLALKSSNVKKTNVTVERAGRGEITSIVTATGKVKAQADVQISADVMGRIERLPVKEGDTVKTGQLLVEIDSRSREMDLAQARGSLLSAQSALDNSRINLDREKALLAKNLTSQATVDIAQSSYDQAAAQVQIDQAVLDRAQDQLDKCTIRAPMSGIITQLNSEAGEMVVIGTMNSPGTVVMVISDLSTIEIEAEVDETDIASVHLGQDVKISLDAFPDTTFRGEVIEVGNSAQTSATYGVASDQITNFLVKVLIKDTVKNIKPGMTASVDITTANRPDAVKIPSGAVVMRPEGTENMPLTPDPKNSGTAKAEEAKNVVTTGKKTKEIDGVFIVAGDQAKFMPVKTGIRDQQFVEIVSGLSEGDSVITGPYKTLRTIKQGEFVNPQKPKFVVSGDSVSVHIE